MNTFWGSIVFLFLGILNLNAQIKTTSDRYVGCVPDSFTFYTLGNTHSGQAWNSGNGSTPIIDSPTFVYGAPGTYNVTIGTFTKQITIYPKINFTFTTDSPKTGCLPFHFNLKDATIYPAGISASNINWVYQNGGGGTGSPIQSTIVNYYNFGCYVNMIVNTNVSSCFGNVKVDSFFKILDVPKAIIDTPALYSCKVPFTVANINKSTDSLKTTLTYLWKWNQPTVGSSTATNPPALTFTSNAAGTITLETTNMFGCKDYDTARIIVDTPSLNFISSTKVCRSLIQGILEIKDLDTTNFIYTFMSDKSIGGEDIFSLYNNGSTNVIRDTFRLFSGFYRDNQYIDTFAYLYIKKTKKADTSCHTIEKKKVYICQRYPVPEVKFSKECKPPFTDTIIAHYWSPCWDTIQFNLVYTDKYGVPLIKTKYNTSKSETIKNLGPDSILYYTINELNKTDSFYRRGPMTLNLSIDFINAETKCSLNSGLYKGENHSLFRPHLVNYKNRGCKGAKDSFVIYDYGIGHIDSVIWDFGDGTITRNRDSIMTHLYPNTGKYIARTIVFNSITGCIDTTNTVEILRADSILPIISISNKTPCISDTINFSISNPSSFDNWYFITDSFKNYNCSNQSTYSWKRFYNTGKQYVNLIAEKDGCFTQSIDSIYIKGPKFNLNYDFKCSRPDTIPFYLTDTFGILGSGVHWDFGDGISYYSFDTFQGHKYIGDSNDYMVKLSATNPDGCYYIDSSLIKIRKVKAIIRDTLFCKIINDGVYLNGLPYKFWPYLSLNADQINRYNYTWQLKSIRPPYYLYPPWTEKDSIWVNIPEDTMMLTLTARDINGCEDKMTKRIIVTDNFIDFKLNYSDSCPPTQMIYTNNLSTSPWGFSSTIWDFSWRKNGNDTLLFTSSSFNDSFLADNALADTFLIQLSLKDNVACRDKQMTQMFIFYPDTSHLIIPDSVCQISKGNIYSTQNDIVNYSYRWYVNGSPVTSPDTLSALNHKFSGTGNFNIRLDKKNRKTGCLRTFGGITYVGPYPRLRIDNSFDTVKNKCFPGVTTIGHFDSANIVSLNFAYWFEGSNRNVNPSIIDLNKGSNEIKAVFSTTYGCKDTFLIKDTVIDPRANLIKNKTDICLGDKVSFELINKFDIDSVFWSFGDGTIRSDTLTKIEHEYKISSTSDTMEISYIAYGPNRTCPFYKKDTLVIYNVEIDLKLNNTSQCFAPVKIYNSSTKADYFKWNFGDGTISNTDEDSFIHTYSNAGKYTITQYGYRNPLGCVDSTKSIINLNPLPKITAKTDSVCLGKELIINYTESFSKTKVYLEPDILKLSPYTKSPIVVNIDNDIKFKLLSVSDSGCRDSIYIQTNVIKPFKELSLDTILEVGKKVILPIEYNNYWTYTWEPKLIKPSCENCPYPELTIYDSVKYELTIEDYRHCFKNTSYYHIRIYPDILVKVPTAFTPNGDGNNDIIYARGFGIKKLLSFKIFNRQGQLIFLTNDEKIGWDGYYKNILQNSDVYYYTYEAESFIPNKIVQGEGNFMLLR